MRYITDAQQALGFMTQQASLIEATVYETQYPKLQYQELVPIDYSAPEWTKSITFYSLDRVGEADWFSAQSTDIRLADIERSSYEQGISMAGIGYRYNIEEVALAMQLGIPLQSERAAAAIRAYEEMCDRVALYGDTARNWKGLINYTGIDRTDVANDGTGTSTHWHDKTSAQIIRDINNLLSDVYSESQQTEMADTLLVPVDHFNILATTPFSTTNDMTILEWFKRYNVLTQQTGQPLMIRSVRGLETAGDTGSARMVLYRNEPSILKMHIPMRHKFLPVYQQGPLVFDIPGIFRLGGLEIRRPGAVRYGDKI